MTAIIPPAGMYPASFFTPGLSFVDPSSPAAVLADNLDGNGEIISFFTTVHPVDAAIRDAFRVENKSGSAVLDTGHQFFKIKKKTSDAPRRMTDEANRIMAPFVARGDAKVLKIEVDTEQAVDLGAAVVTYTNLRTSQTQVTA